MKKTKMADMSFVICMTKTKMADGRQITTSITKTNGLSLSALSLSLSALSSLSINIKWPLGTTSRETLDTPTPTRQRSTLTHSFFTRMKRGKTFKSVVGTVSRPGPTASPFSRAK